MPTRQLALPKIRTKQASLLLKHSPVPQHGSELDKQVLVSPEQLPEGVPRLIPWVTPFHRAHSQAFGCPTLYIAPPDTRQSTRLS